ncbi:hypothetical protein EON63_16995 [archaeon]|nr:MAG: hypothetical protein EON63_16995 [archaeon]
MLERALVILMRRCGDEYDQVLMVATTFTISTLSYLYIPIPISSQSPSPSHTITILIICVDPGSAGQSALGVSGAATSVRSTHAG